MEDDLDFTPGFSRLWGDAYKALGQQDWSIFYPAHILEGEPEGLSLVEPGKKIQCAHFFMVHRDAVGRIVEGLETIMSRPAGHPEGGPMHVDGAYCTIRDQNPDLRTFIFSPSLGYQRSSRSDMADQRFFDAVPALRGTMNTLRRIKRAFR